MLVMGGRSSGGSLLERKGGKGTRFCECREEHLVRIDGHATLLYTRLRRALNPRGKGESLKCT